MGGDYKRFITNLSPDVSIITDEPLKLNVGDQAPKRKREVSPDWSKPSEHNEQVALFAWALSPATLASYPELITMYAIPNAGKRSPQMGAFYKAEGLRPGVPDIHLPVARGGYHGLYIEMKVGSNKPTQNQLHWLTILIEQGHSCHVCYSCADAMDVIEAYLNIQPTPL